MIFFLGGGFLGVTKQKGQFYICKVMMSHKMYVFFFLFRFFAIIMKQWHLEDLLQSLSSPS